MAKLGTKKKPVRGHVQTLERAQAILEMYDDRGWTAVIGIDPDKPEDISEVQRLLNPPKPKQAGPNNPSVLLDWLSLLQKICPAKISRKFWQLTPIYIPIVVKIARTIVLWSSSFHGVSESRIEVIICY